MSALYFLEGGGVLLLLFVLFKRGAFKKKFKLEEKAAAVGRGHIWYLTSPKKQANVLLLHDFATDKEQWAGVFPLLVEAGYHVVAPDLPGFGKNLRDIEGKYDATSLAKQVRSFARAVDLGAFHLVGAGTGAVVAASYAYGMPGELASVTLIEPVGISAPGESDFEKVMAKGRNPLLPATPQAYDYLLGFVTTNPPPMAAAVKKKRSERLAATREFYQRVWTDLCEGDRAHLVDLLLPEIKVRTLILFGSRSRMVHPGAAKMQEKRLEGGKARVQVLPEAGHWMMVERPKELAAMLVSFFRAPAPKPAPKPAEDVEAAAAE